MTGPELTSGPVFWPQRSAAFNTRAVANALWTDPGTAEGGERGA